MLWVDWLIVLFIGLAVFQGFRRGFVAQVFQIIAIILALVVSFWLYPILAGWAERHLQIPISFARPISLAVIFFFAAFAFEIFGGILQRLFAPILQANPINRGAGALLGGVRQTFFVSVILALVVALPLPASMKLAIERSTLAQPLINMALKFENIFDSAIKDDTLKSVNYRIVGTDESTTTALNYTVADPKDDLEGEAKMFALVNHYRQQNDVPMLKINPQLREVARNHGRDMLAKGYFSHISPQGKDVLARTRDAKISLSMVGENLASAPTVEIAHVGLLGSEGHRKNIVNREFNQVGISVLDAGKHGRMIVQVFARIP